MSKFELKDCMIEMKEYPDKYFDLAIVDPPYGKDMSQELFKRGQTCKKNGYKEHKNKDWDKQIPKQGYFDELFRVSKNQIIWGGNYFTQHLKPIAAWICWDKMQYNFSFADGELAWTSFDRSLVIFRYARGNESGFAPRLKGHQKIGTNIHPTQKPIALYRWLLQNYANENDLILDTHVGSASSLIACEELGFDYVGFEIDPDYYNLAKNRLEKYFDQLQLFKPAGKRADNYKQSVLFDE